MTLSYQTQSSKNRCCYRQVDVPVVPHRSQFKAYSIFLLLFSSVFLKLNVFTIDWRMITLQYCVCFSRTSIRMNHRYSLCPLPLETPSHLPPHPTPLSYYRALGLSSLCHTTNSHRLSISYMVMCMFSMLLSQSVPPSLSPTVSTSVFSMSASPLLPCK